MIVGLTAKQWSALCEALEMHADVADLQRGIGLDLGLEGNRFLAREQIAALVHLRVSRRPFVEIAGLFNRAGRLLECIPDGCRLVAGDPACSEANPLFAVTEQSGVGRILAPTVPLDFSRWRPSAAAAGAAPGRAHPLRPFANRGSQRCRDSTSPRRPDCSGRAVGTDPSTGEREQIIYVVK